MVLAPIVNDMKKYYLERGKLGIEVLKADVRKGKFGRVDVLVVPIEGYGEEWVYETSLKTKKPENLKPIK